MLDIKLIRKEPDLFIKKLSERNIKVNIKDLLSLDKENRDLIQKKEKLEQEKKIISQKKDKTQFAKSKKLTDEIDEISKKQIKLCKQIVTEQLKITIGLKIKNKLMKILKTIHLFW